MKLVIFGSLVHEKSEPMCMKLIIADVSTRRSATICDLCYMICLLEQFKFVNTTQLLYLVMSVLYNIDYTSLVKADVSITSSPTLCNLCYTVHLYEQFNLASTLQLLYHVMRIL